MIGTSRSFEHRSYAVNCAHLMPVIPDREIGGFHVPGWCWPVLMPAFVLVLHFAGAF